MSNTKPSNPKDILGSNKLPVHLWPETATILGAMGLLEGALKYGRSNWRAVGIRASIYYDAIRRHTAAWFEGEDTDPVSGLPHIAHILANAGIIADAGAAGKLSDDRMIEGGYLKLLSELTPHVARLKEKYAGQNPKHYTIADNDLLHIEDDTDFDNPSMEPAIDGVEIPDGLIVVDDNDGVARAFDHKTHIQLNLPAIPGNTGNLVAFTPAESAEAKQEFSGCGCRPPAADLVALPPELVARRDLAAEAFHKLFRDILPDDHTLTTIDQRDEAIRSHILNKEAEASIQEIYGALEALKPNAAGAVEAFRELCTDLLRYVRIFGEIDADPVEVNARSTVGAVVGPDDSPDPVEAGLHVNCGCSAKTGEMVSLSPPFAFRKYPNGKSDGIAYWYDGETVTWNDDTGRVCRVAFPEKEAEAACASGDWTPTLYHSKIVLNKFIPANKGSTPDTVAVFAVVDTQPVNYLSVGDKQWQNTNPEEMYENSEDWQEA